MNDNTNDQRLITIAEAAGILNVSEKTVHRIISIGRVHEITRKMVSDYSGRMKSVSTLSSRLDGDH
jgi:plasmid maintenance system antidote protein VapI